MEKLKKMIEEANKKCAEWEQKTFCLGSAFSHCEKLKNCACPELLEALKKGIVKIDMPSEYYSPRFCLKEN